MRNETVEGAENSPPFDATKITRPAPELFNYYLVKAILTLPAVVIVLPVLWFRYVTLRYRFDEEGISMRWGVLFQREVLLTYRRIQDIHVTRDLIQRWLGLATVSIQTASGSSSPEMTIEGILQAEELRDYLYQKMRGAKGQVDEVPLGDQKLDSTSEVTQLLRAFATIWLGWLNSKKVRDERSSVASFRVVLSRYLADRDRVVASSGAASDTSGAAGRARRFLSTIAWISSISQVLFLVGIIDRRHFLDDRMDRADDLSTVGRDSHHPDRSGDHRVAGCGAYIAIHLRYDTTWYVLTDRSMRIRRGIWNIHETTITFENIQNIHLSQGPLQRHYGIADLVVQTAGGGSATGPHGEQLNTGAHIGILEGLDHAEQVRDLIMQRLKSLKTTGLGDERSADHKEGTGGFSEVDLQLLREIHQITARLSHSQS